MHFLAHHHHHPRSIRICKYITLIFNTGSYEGETGFNVGTVNFAKRWGRENIPPSSLIGFLSPSPSSGCPKPGYDCTYVPNYSKDHNLHIHCHEHPKPHIYLWMLSIKTTAILIIIGHIIRINILNMSWCMHANISEEHSASIFRVKEYATKSSASACFLPGILFNPEGASSIFLHGGIFQNMLLFFMVTTARNSKSNTVTYNYSNYHQN